jgi:hypothetical protein
MNELKKITRTYDIISDMKKNKVTEAADIKGVDELVYNPVTKKGGAIGYGYDNGQKKEGITWSGHDDHLHIGFTTRDAAIAIINKADLMGLKTTENPYAKKDPNNKVDNVHTGGSLHYKNFEGTPTVGMAVDISGDQTKITELIKWIESTYASGWSQSNNTGTETGTETGTVKPSQEGGYLSSIASNIAKSIVGKDSKGEYNTFNVLDMVGLKEDIDRIKELLK